MGNYRINVKICIRDDSGKDDSSSIDLASVVPEVEATNIDAVEKALLEIIREAVRKAVGRHLEAISRKTARERQAATGGVIRENEKEYRVEGEIGRIRFKTHQVVVEDKVVFDTSKDIYRVLRSREWYRSEGFNEIAFMLVPDMSYRKAAATLNRVRGEEENGTPSRTLANDVELEGRKVQEAIEEISKETLKEHDFTTEGKPKGENSEYGKERESASLPRSTVVAAIEEYNKDRDDREKIDDEQCEKFYENAEKTTNISLDDVVVKKQKDTGRDAAKVKKEHREYVQNTIGHIEQGGKRYILSSTSIVALIPLLVAFLLHNKLMSYHLQFFVDGARSLKKAILETFSWHKSIGIILDWYHLKDKCKRELSLALRNSRLRNLLLEQILPLLWLGKTDAVIGVLRWVSKEYLKDGRTTEALIAYLERNREYIPCYALRKKLGLRNSSNKGEKSNDLAVSSRQKHNGMSWSKVGSPALTTITVLHLNNEQKNWYRHSRIDYQMAERDAA